MSLYDDFEYVPKPAQQHDPLCTMKTLRLSSECSVCVALRDARRQERNMALYKKD